MHCKSAKWQQTKFLFTGIISGYPISTPLLGLYVTRIHFLNGNKNELKRFILIWNLKLLYALIHLWRAVKLSFWPKLVCGGSVDCDVLLTTSLVTEILRVFIFLRIPEDPDSPASLVQADMADAIVFYSGKIFQKFFSVQYH